MPAEKMVIIFEEMKNAEYKQIHRDFIIETCLSFDVPVFESIPDDLKGTPVYLSQYGDIELSSFELPNNAIVFVGCDDNREPDQIEGISVRIDTPKNYYLWSAVALGIFLYHLKGIKD